MGVRPRLPSLDLPEAEQLLLGLMRIDQHQLLRGIPPISAALKVQAGRRALRYIRADPAEEWLTLRDIWLRGGGDCEDLAAGVAAELSLAGFDARPVIERVRPGLAHALVEVRQGTRRVRIDPSRTGGMGEP